MHEAAAVWSSFITLIKAPLPSCALWTIKGLRTCCMLLAIELHAALLIDGRQSSCVRPQATQRLKNRHTQHMAGALHRQAQGGHSWGLSPTLALALSRL